MRLPLKQLLKQPHKLSLGRSHHPCPSRYYCLPQRPQLKSVLAQSERTSCLLSSMVVKLIRYSEAREVISNAINKLGINLMKLLYQNTHGETLQHH